MGRPSKYKKKYCKAIIAYFKDAPLYQEVETEIYDKKKDEYRTKCVKVATLCPSFTRFAEEIGVNPDTLQEWKKNYEEFAAAYETAKHYQEEWLMNASGMGYYNAAVGIMALKSNHGWTDRTDNVNTMHGGLSVSIKQYPWEEGDGGNPDTK